MKHKGKAMAAAAAILAKSVIAIIFLAAFTSLLWPGGLAGLLTAVVCCGLGLLFSAFTLYFFRDPDARVPADPAVVVAPAHGKIDVIDETEELVVMGGKCRRVSIFLSVFDVHVQQAPVAGEVTLVKHTPGQYLNAMRTDCSQFNENVLVGFKSSSPAGVSVGVRLITGLIARRIIPWVQVGETVAKGERIALIQFGSRANLYLPLNAEITATLGQRAVGGETVIARIPG